MAVVELAWQDKLPTGHLLAAFLLCVASCQLVAAPAAHEPVQDGEDEHPLKVPRKVYEIAVEYRDEVRAEGWQQAG